MVQRILVTGATGVLGEPVARSLRRAGFSVRVMSRYLSRARAIFSEAFEIFEGDALIENDVERALTGCDAMHISIDHNREDECVRHLVAAARTQEIKRISYVSGTTVCTENRWFPLVDRKLKSEHAIIDSGIEYAIFCPGWFMEMLARFVRGGQAIVFGNPSQRWHFVAAQDFAAMVAESYRRTEAVNKRFYVHGPQAHTVTDALQAYCRALHPEIPTLRPIPYWLLHLISRLGGSSELRAGVDMVSYLERVGERGDPAEANALLGAPQITLDEWLMMQKAGAVR